MKQWLQRIVGFLTKYMDMARQQQEPRRPETGNVTMLMDQLVKIDERLVLIEKHQALIFRTLSDRQQP